MKKNLHQNFVWNRSTMTLLFDSLQIVGPIPFTLFII